MIDPMEDFFCKSWDITWKHFGIFTQFIIFIDNLYGY